MPPLQAVLPINGSAKSSMMMQVLPMGIFRVTFILFVSVQLLIVLLIYMCRKMYNPLNLNSHSLDQRDVQHINTLPTTFIITSNSSRSLCYLGQLVLLLCMEPSHRT